MPQFVQLLVIFSLNFSVFARRNNRFHASLFRFLDNCIRIIASVGQKRLGLNAIYQFFNLATICCGTFCNKDSDRHTMRIHGQMYLGVEPPFVLAIS